MELRKRSIRNISTIRLQKTIMLQMDAWCPACSISWSPSSSSLASGAELEVAYVSSASLIRRTRSATFITLSGNASLIKSTRFNLSLKLLSVGRLPEYIFNSKIPYLYISPSFGAPAPNPYYAYQESAI